MRIAFLFFFSLQVFYAQIPEYYSSVNFSLTGESLKAQLSQLITETHDVFLSYTPGTWEAIKITDLDPEDSSKVLLVYGYDDDDGVSKTDRTRGVDDNCTGGSCIGLWNREHVYARSLGTPNLGFSNSGADVHNLRACDSQMNSSRGNRKFTEGSGNADLAGIHYYPGDEWIGDVARMMMYMYLRYNEQCLPVNVGDGPTDMSTLGDMPNIFLIWNTLDAVSEYELVRNDVLETLQGNRNPFIDNPYLATRIWGGPEAEDTWGLLSRENTKDLVFGIYPTVTSGRVFFTSSLSSGFEGVNFEIFTVSGQKIAEGSGVETDMSNFTNGIYLIQVKGHSFQEVYKIVKR